MSDTPIPDQLPVTIGVLSDTHIYPQGARQLPPPVLALFEGAGVDLILHLAGDYFYWLGDEWLKTQTVLDEDRRVYVYYAKKTA